MLLLLVTGFIASQAQDVQPQFSTESDPVYYRLQFNTGDAYLQDQGAGKQMQTVLAYAKNGQTYALIGTQNDFIMRTDLGNYATINASGFFETTATAAQAAHLALINSPNHAGCYEITKKNDTNKGMNQWGGTGAGKKLGLWNKGDNNNGLKFYPANYVPPLSYTAYKATLSQGGAEYKFTARTVFSPENRHTLWYAKPAMGVTNPWMEYSLPIGNGSLGASLFGGMKTDEIQFNEKTLWEGGPNDIGNGGDGSTTTGYGRYMNFGGVFVKNLAEGIFSTNTTRPAKGYVRFLDIDQGVGGVEFADADGTQYSRRYIASEPDGVIAAHYTSDGTNKMHLLFTLVAGDELHNTPVVYGEDGTATFGGKLKTVYYGARFKIVAADGTMTKTENGIEVKDATDILLILCGGTSFDNKATTRTSGDAETVANRIKDLVNAAATKTWSQLYSAHVENFKSFMGRVDFNIANAASTRNTEALVKYYGASLNNKDSKEGLFLEELYFHYGRYLEISSSRGSAHVPNNLQGIWNNSAHAPWNSDVHTNINVQMNYWPAEQTNLSECHLPFLDFIIDNSTSANWIKAAKLSKQTKGWTVFTESNIFGGMSKFSSNYCVANAWYCTHLWDHYRYTLDKDFLKRAFPAMWSSAEFWMERLKKDTKVKDGTWVCPNEWSPEHGPNEDGVAHAQQLVRANLQICRDAINVVGAADLGLNPGDLSRLDNYLDHIDTGLHIETYQNDWGQQQAKERGIKKGDNLLREWKYSSYKSGQGPNHRHMSHLMCLFPLNQVHPGDGGYFDAAVNSLRFRGDIATGWSMGWKANLWARAKDGNHARTILKNALRHSTTYSVDESQGGIYYNLYDSHANFQIDGNFGMCSGIAQMLLQSQNDVLEILPALPTAWKDGNVTGLKAIGNFTVDIAWKANKATAVKITSHKGTKLLVKDNKDLTTVQVRVDGKAVKVMKTTQSDTYQFDGITAGQTVIIDYTLPSDNPSGITSAKSDSAKHIDKIYDLTGRQTTKNTHGIQIVNGNKVIH